MNVKFFVIFSTLIAQALAYVPSVESMFRNGANTDVGQSTVSALLKISKKASAENSDSNFSSAYNDHLVRVFIGNEVLGKPKLVQVSYAGHVAKNSDINSVSYRPEFEYGKMGLGPEDVSGMMFYAVLSSVLNNDGEMLVRFLQDQGVPVKLNAEVINREKLALLQRYSEYLRLKGSDENLKNPLKSEDSEKQKSIDELMKSPFYMKSPFVSKVREGDSFFWQIKSSNFEARLKDESRQIQYIKLQTATGELKFLFSDYVIASEKFEVPRKVTIMEAGQDVFEIEFQKVELLSEKGQNFATRLKELTEEKNKNNLSRNRKPLFLL